MKVVGDFLHELIFSGGIKKGGTWGGPECTSAVPLERHILEIGLWVAAILIGYYCLDLGRYCHVLAREANAHLEKCSQKYAWKRLDQFLFVAHLLLWVSVLNYKINLKSLVNLLQPCHLALFFEGLALVVSGENSVFISILVQPLTVGAVFALAFPATEGLDQPCESDLFFVQHYLLLITPIYLLARNEFLVLKLNTLKSLMAANLVIAAVHWVFFAPFDRFFQVNVNFFLCPSLGMVDAFAGMPPLLLWPSYRTFLSLLTFFSSISLHYVYVGIVSCLKHFVLEKSIKRRQE